MGLILFIDESGDHSLSKIDAQYPVFVLCGVIIDENYQNQTATDALNHFKERLFGRRDIILHTADFTRNQAGFEDMAAHDFRERFFGELRTLIVALNFKVVACVVQKQEHLKKYGLHAVDPYMLSLSILIERFIFECGSAGGSVFAEARDATLNNALELAFFSNEGSEADTQLHNSRQEGEHHRAATRRRLCHSNWPTRNWEEHLPYLQ